MKNASDGLLVALLVSQEWRAPLSGGAASIKGSQYQRDEMLRSILGHKGQPVVTSVLPAPQIAGRSLQVLITLHQFPLNLSPC